MFRTCTEITARRRPRDTLLPTFPSNPQRQHVIRVPIFIDVSDAHTIWDCRIIISRVNR